MSDDITQQGADEGGWRRRFKGRVVRISHTPERITVRVEIYSQPRPAASTLTSAQDLMAELDRRNEARMAIRGKSYEPEEQVLFLSTVDPASRLLLRVAAHRDDPTATIARVELQARTNKYPLLPGRTLKLRLGAGEREFADPSLNPFGYTFADVPISMLGELWVELDVMPPQ